MQGIHSTFELGVDVPGVGGIEFVLKFGLTGEQGVHLIGVFEHIGVAERFIDLVKFSKEVHDGLHTFAHNLDDSFLRVELRVLFEIAHGVAGREDNFALIALVNACYDFQQRRLTGAVQTDDADLGTVEE